MPPTRVNNLTMRTGPETTQMVIFARIFLIALCAVFLIGVMFPRFLGFGPALIGLLSFLAFRPVYGCWLCLPKFYLFWAGAIIALIGLSTFWSIDPDFARERTGKVALLLTGGGFLYAVTSSIPAQISTQFNRYFPAAFIAAAAFCMTEFFTHGAIHDFFRPDIDALAAENLSKLNRGAVLMILCTFIALYQLRFLNSQKTKALMAIAIMLPIAVLFCTTQSQSAQLALMMGLIVYAFFPLNAKPVWLCLGAGLALLIGAAPWLAQILFQTLPPHFDTVEWLTQGPSAFARMEIWSFIASRALENPLWGFGVEATRHITDFETQRLYHGSSEILHPHNVVLQIWIEFGVLGAVLLSALCGSLLGKIFETPREAKRLYLSLFTTAFTVSAFGYGIWQGWWLGGLTLILCYATLSSRDPKNDGSG